MYYQERSHILCYEINYIKLYTYSFHATFRYRSSDDRKHYGKPLRTVILFIDNVLYNRFGSNVLKKQLYWYIFVISRIKFIFMSTLSYQCIAFIQ